MWIEINKNSETPLIRQIYEQIRVMILSGTLKAGDKLPSTRQLASELGISRIVVMEAYELLYAEGYTETRQGSGTTVAEGAFLDALHEQPRRPAGATYDSDSRNSDLINLRAGVPAVDLFPRKEWGRLLQKACLEMPDALFGYGRPQGLMELRRAIAGYLQRARGIDCSPDRIYITSGTTQTLAILARILFAPGAEVILEDPSSTLARRIISAGNFRIVPVTVDHNGMQTELVKISDRTSFVFVTPSHQFPMGEVLPIQRRLELVRLVKNTDCYIVEDDYDSEFRFGGHPVSTMYGCEPTRVIYLGTFSKAFSPALRLGYAILPDDLGPSFLGCKMDMDLHNAVPDQMALAYLINEGGYEKHISKMKKVYRQRQQAMISALEGSFPGIKISGQSTGLNLIAEFPGVDFTESLQHDAVKAGVKIHPVEKNAFVKGRHRGKLIIGYGHLTPDKIKEAVARLKSVLH